MACPVHTPVVVSERWKWLHYVHGMDNCKNAIVYMPMSVSYILYPWFLPCLVFIVFECIGEYLFLAGEKDGCFFHPVLCGCSLTGVSWVPSEGDDY